MTALYTQLEASLGDAGFFSGLDATIRATAPLQDLLSTYGLTADTRLPTSMTDVFWREKSNAYRAWISGDIHVGPTLFLVHDLLVEASVKADTSGAIKGIRSIHIHGLNVWLLIFCHARAKGYSRLRGPLEQIDRPRIEELGVMTRHIVDEELYEFELTGLDLDAVQRSLTKFKGYRNSEYSNEWNLHEAADIPRSDMPGILKRVGMPGPPSANGVLLFVDHDDKWIAVRLTPESDDAWMLLNIHTGGSDGVSPTENVASVQWAILTASKHGIKEIYLNQYIGSTLLRLLVDQVGFKPGQYYYHLVIDETAINKALRFFIYN